MEVKLYVGNLAYSTTEEELHVLFAQAGKVTSVNLVQDQGSGRSKGFAFVTLSTQAEAQRAVSQFNAFSLAGRMLKVSVAKLSPATSGYQSQLSAFSSAGQEPTKVQPSQTRGVPGGFQSRLGAFGPGSIPASTRRGRSQRR